MVTPRKRPATKRLLTSVPPAPGRWDGDNLELLFVPKETIGSMARAAAHSAALGERVFLVVDGHPLAQDRLAKMEKVHPDEQTKVRRSSYEETIEYRRGGWVRIISTRMLDRVRGMDYTMVLYDSGL